MKMKQVLTEAKKTLKMAKNSNIKTEAEQIKNILKK
jgi:hypothetical protein